MSCQPCGCDPEAQYTCERHVKALAHSSPVASVTTAGPREEVIVTDPKTGGKKGSKIQRFSLIPREFLWALATHYGVGALKYEDRNWEKGYKWSLSVDAVERHFTQWLRGEDNDAETGTNHLVCAAWHLVALFIFQLRGLGTDDVRTNESRNSGTSQSGTGTGGGILVGTVRGMEDNQSSGWIAGPPGWPLRQTSRE